MVSKIKPYKKLTIYDKKSLVASVKRYRACSVMPNAELADVGFGAEECGLCLKYLMPAKGSHCSRCPIRTHTGELYCRGTPYHPSDKVQCISPMVDRRRFTAVRKRCAEEADFLQSLIDNDPGNKPK